MMMIVMTVHTVCSGVCEIVVRCFARLHAEETCNPVLYTDSGRI